MSKSELKPLPEDKCKSCGAAILWGKTVKGKPVPLDAKTEMRYVRQGNEMVLCPTYKPHHATCPSVEQHYKMCSKKGCTKKALYGVKASEQERAYRGYACGEHVTAVKDAGWLVEKI